MVRRGKRAMALETVVKAVLVLVVLAVLIAVFFKMIFKESDTTRGKVDDLKNDWDDDGVSNIIDVCCCTPVAGKDDVAANGCARGEARLSCSSPSAASCKPQGT